MYKKLNFSFRRKVQNPRNCKYESNCEYLFLFVLQKENAITQLSIRIDKNRYEKKKRLLSFRGKNYKKKNHPYVCTTYHGNLFFCFLHKIFYYDSFSFVIYNCVIVFSLSLLQKQKRGKAP
jgi:hypothetical protein